LRNFHQKFQTFFFVNGTSQDENGSGTKPMSNEFKVESTTIGKLKSNPYENYTGNFEKLVPGIMKTAVTVKAVEYKRRKTCKWSQR
jgi:hypothetical protein